MSEKQELLTTNRKALTINLDGTHYGTIAEIGAGQEVARWFFRVGGAAGTIAKAMSAYDMTFSDAIYGSCERYVSKQRIQSMLDHEFRLLFERLDAKRGDKTQFFVFANTVAAKSFSRKDDPHGWLGIRFQTAPRTDPSQNRKFAPCGCRLVKSSTWLVGLFGGWPPVCPRMRAGPSSGGSPLGRRGGTSAPVTDPTQVPST